MINGWIPWCENHLKNGIFVTDSVPHKVKVVHDKSIIRLSWANMLNLVEHDSSADQRGISCASEGPMVRVFLPKGMKAQAMVPHGGFRQCSELAAGFSLCLRAQGTRPHSL